MKRSYLLFAVIFLVAAKIIAMDKPRHIANRMLKSHTALSLLNKHNLSSHSLRKSSLLTSKNSFQSSKLMRPLALITSTKITENSTNPGNSIAKRNFETIAPYLVMFYFVSRQLSKVLEETFEDSNDYVIDQDDPWFQANQGLLYSQNGDIEKAKHYYTLAADQGYAIGQYNLGVLQLKEGNIEQAIHNFILAADQGENAALFALGEYYQSIGDIEKAKNYYTLATQKNYIFAQKELDDLCQNERNGSRKTQ